MSNPQDILDLYDGYTPPKGSGNFFSLEDGKTARVRFYSEPYIYRDLFKQPDGTNKASLRYAWKVWNHEENKAQILKQSGTFYSSLVVLVKDPDYGDPTTYDVKITRTGTGTDTKYTINGAKKNLDIPEEALAELASLDVLEDAKEAMIMPLRQYVKAGNKFPDEVDDDGSPAVKDLD